MSWNPFNKLIAPKKSTSKLNADDDFEKEVRMFTIVENSSKKLCKDARRSSESHNNELKACQRVSQDLLSNISSVSRDKAATNVTEHIEKFKRLAFSVEVKQLELATIVQHSLLEPMKQFNAVFPNVHLAMKSREQSLQDLTKYQSKRERFQEKDLTPQQSAKFDANEKYLGFARTDFEKRHRNLVTDLGRLHEVRLEYFRPCFEALMKAQYTFFEEALQLYDDFLVQVGEGDTLECNSENSDGSDSERCQILLREIKSLSIVGSR